MSIKSRDKIHISATLLLFREKYIYHCLKVKCIFLIVLKKKKCKIEIKEIEIYYLDYNIHFIIIDTEKVFKNTINRVSFTR